MAIAITVRALIPVLGAAGGYLLGRYAGKNTVAAALGGAAGFFAGGLVNAAILRGETEDDARNAVGSTISADPIPVAALQIALGSPRPIPYPDAVRAAAQLANLLPTVPTAKNQETSQQTMGPSMRPAPSASVAPPAGGVAAPSAPSSSGGPVTVAAGPAIAPRRPLPPGIGRQAGRRA